MRANCYRNFDTSSGLVHPCMKKRIQGLPTESTSNAGYGLARLIGTDFIVYMVGHFPIWSVTAKCGVGFHLDDWRDRSSY